MLFDSTGFQFVIKKFEIFEKCRCVYFLYGGCLSYFD